MSGTLARFELKKGTKTAPSRHVQEQFTYVVRGRLKYEVGREEALLEEGQVLHVGSNITHLANVLEDSVVLDFFVPAWPDLPNPTKR